MDRLLMIVVIVLLALNLIQNTAPLFARGSVQEVIIVGVRQAPGEPWDALNTE